MYLNKILFPAPHSTYSAKQFDKELFWVTRYDLPKSGKSSHNILDKKDPTNSCSKLKVLSLFKKTPTAKYSLNSVSEKLGSIKIETENHNDDLITFRGIEIAQEKPTISEITPSVPVYRRSISSMKSRPKDTTIDFMSKTSILDNRKDIKKEDIVKKKKKSVTACWSFLSKHKEKKVSLDLVDSPHENVPCDSPSYLKGETGNIMLDSHQNHFEGNRESSSESDEEIAGQGKKAVQIPCLYLKSRIPSKKTLLYFHGNAEDLNTSYDFLRHLSNNLMMDLVAMEYPGYGVYRGSPSEKKVLLDAEALYNHLVNHMKINEEDIIIFGRSIGSGPATWLASIKNPGMLILMSPFTSVKAVANHIAGRIAKCLVKERFNNINHLKNVKCPVFIVHGKKDTLIPYSQSLQLYDCVKGQKKIYLAEEMTHSNFDFLTDISVPIVSWLKELNLLNIGETGKETDRLNISFSPISTGTRTKVSAGLAEIC